jgi:hypothetical protein
MDQNGEALLATLAWASVLSPDEARLEPGLS